MFQPRAASQCLSLSTNRRNEDRPQKKPGGFTSYEQIFKACSRPKAYASDIGTYSVPSKL